MVVDWDVIGPPDELEPGSYRVRLLGWRVDPSPLTYCLDLGCAEGSVQHVEYLVIGTINDPTATHRYTWGTSHGARQLKAFFQAMGFVVQGEPEGMLAQAVTAEVSVRMVRDRASTGKIYTRFYPLVADVQTAAPALVADEATSRVELLRAQAREIARAQPPVLPSGVAIPPPLVASLPRPSRESAAEATPQHLGQLGGVTVRRVIPPPVVCPRCQRTMPREDWGEHIEGHDREDEALEVDE